MAIVVKKFGGSSVGNVELIRGIAQRLAKDYRSGDKLVLVVSAMAKTTDKLFDLAYQISPHPSRRELDMLLTAGERISMSLLSLALLEEGIASISFTGSQSGIITDKRHGNARILKVNAFRIHEELAQGKVVIVAGFQGVSTSKEITTLGRGGSDTSAVALASYLGAERCEIYTDVAGVFTADPRIVPDAKFIPEIGYQDMLALAYSGSKVMHPRAVEYACKYRVKVEIKSSFSFDNGTIMQAELPGGVLDNKGKGDKMEDRFVSAIAHKDNLMQYRLTANAHAVELLKHWQHEIFKLAQIEGELEIYVESKYAQDIDFYLKQKGCQNFQKNDEMAFVVLVGLGLASDPLFVAQVMELMLPLKLQRICHSERALELMLPRESIPEALKLLHQEIIGDRK